MNHITSLSPDKFRRANLVNKYFYRYQPHTLAKELLTECWLAGWSGRRRSFRRGWSG